MRRQFCIGRTRQETQQKDRNDLSPRSNYIVIFMGMGFLLCVFQNLYKWEWQENECMRDSHILCLRKFNHFFFYEKKNHNLLKWTFYFRGWINNFSFLWGKNMIDITYMYMTNYAYIRTLTVNFLIIWIKLLISSLLTLKWSNSYHKDISKKLKKKMKYIY